MSGLETRTHRYKRLRKRQLKQFKKCDRLTCVVVKQGYLTTLELEPLLERHNRLALQLAEMAT